MNDEPRTTDKEVKDLRVLVPTLKAIVKDRPEALTFTVSRDVFMALLIQTEGLMKRVATYDEVRKHIYDTLGDDETVQHIGWVKANTYREIIKRMDGDA